MSENWLGTMRAGLNPMRERENRLGTGCSKPVLIHAHVVLLGAALHRKLHPHKDYDAIATDSLAGKIFLIDALKKPNIFASCSVDNTIKLWDITSGSLLVDPEGAYRNVLGVTFDPDPLNIVAG